MRGVYKDSLSQIVLTILEKSVDSYVRLEDFLYNPGFVAFGSGRELKKSELAKTLKRLRERGLIKQEKIRDDLIFRLTAEGGELLNNDNQDNWDGKWRIVSFDIPEQKRVMRNLFRRNLKKWGFKYLHKSVWVSKRNIYNKMTEYIKELKIEPWVTIIEADKVSGL